MDDIHQKILDDIKRRESWCQPFVLPHSNKIINLSNAIGKNPTTPPDALTNQVDISNKVKTNLTNITRVLKCSTK